MKYIIKIHELFKELADDQIAESKTCMERKMIYAMAYADGKEQAYRHAAKIVEAYINNELPWGEE